MTRLVCVGVACFALVAGAVARGGSLYVVGAGVKLLKEPKATSAAVMPTVLAPGTEVKWLGASDKDRRFHQVEVHGKKASSPCRISRRRGRSMKSPRRISR
ncbi:MAG: hypothetical protein QM817_31985 [Archangium sp.]